MKNDALLEALVADFEGLALVDTSSLLYGVGTNYLIPYVLTRSAVFSSKTFKGKGKQPIITERTELGTYGPVSVFQLMGPVLTGYERDVFQEVVKLAVESDSRVANGTIRIQFEANAMLRRLNREIGGSNRAWLAERLQFLNGAQFAVESSAHPDKILGAHLLYDVRSAPVRNTEKKKGNVLYTVLLNESLAKIFYMGWSVVSEQVYNALSGNKSAQALLAFYATHKNPIPLKPTALRSILGRSGRRMDMFLTETLVPALKALKAATGWSVCEIKNGAVVVQKKSGQKSKDAERVVEPATPVGASAKRDTKEAFTAWLIQQDDQALLSVLFAQGSRPSLDVLYSVEKKREQVLALFHAGLTIAEAETATADCDI